jgi:phage tail protein X
MPNALLDDPGTLFDWPNEPFDSGPWPAPYSGPTSAPIAEDVTGYAFSTSSLYRTVAGDTPDLISFKVYASEWYMNVILDSNPAYNATTIFDGNSILYIPPIAQVRSLPLPPWFTGQVLTS